MARFGGWPSWGRRRAKEKSGLRLGEELVSCCCWCRAIVPSEDVALCPFGCSFARTAQSQGTHKYSFFHPKENQGVLTPSLAPFAAPSAASLFATLFAMLLATRFAALAGELRGILLDFGVFACQLSKVVLGSEWENFIVQHRHGRGHGPHNIKVDLERSRCGGWTRCRILFGEHFC